MLKTLAAAFLCSALVAGCIPPAESPTTKLATPAAPAANPTVGGAAMLSNRTILENVSASSIHSRLVAALRAGGIDASLSGQGPYTLFAPSNAAFDRLPAGTLDSLLLPANKPELVRLLRYHLVEGRKTRAQIAADARSGRAAYTTLGGGTLRVAVEGGRIAVTDFHGNKVYVATGDVQQSNGVFHVVDAVLLPPLG